MADVVDLDSRRPHFSAELICVGCHHRAVHVWLAETPLRRLECITCGETGLLILTGQPSLPGRPDDCCGGDDHDGGAAA